jgi:glucose dehydrogenase
MRSREAWSSRFTAVAMALSLAGIGTWLVAPTRAQGGTSGDWSSHNFDLHNSRFSPLDLINTSNVSGLTQQWSIETGGADTLKQVTPLVVDGVMYYNAGSKLFAVNAATGASLWTYQVDPPFPGVGRGPAYGDGRIYAYGGPYGGNVLYAIDAKTGQPLQSFGSKGRLLVADEVLKFKYPDRDATGYRTVSAPAYLNGMLYVGLSQSEKHIPGGLVAAIDGKTGAVKWVFSTIPQKPTDDGWEITKDSWIGGQRVGGGIWTQPAIDAELGLVYVNAGNPSPDYEPLHQLHHRAASRYGETGLVLPDDSSRSLGLGPGDGTGAV